MRCPQLNPSSDPPGYGAPLTVLPLDGGAPGAADLSSFLWEAPGAAGRFAGIIMHPDVEALGYMTAAQASAIKEYQRQTGARALKFDSAPASYGMAPAACASGDARLALTPAAPLGASGVRAGAALSGQGLKR
jgi:hypothetical protein